MPDFVREPLIILEKLSPEILAKRTADMVGDHGQKPAWWPGRHKWDEVEHDFSRSMARAAEKASRVVKRHGIIPGRRLGAGVSGVVHEAGEGNVIKFDKGHNEARLAHAIINTPGLRNLSTLPRYHQVIETGVHDEKTNEPIYAIHREDIGNLSSKTPESWANFGNDIHHLSMAIRGGKMKHSEMDKNISSIAEKHRDNFHPSEQKHFDNVVRDVRKMSKHGLLPCDLHADNWGQRSNGEIVMRDTGCYSLSELPSSPGKLANSSWAAKRPN